ncbi:MAG: MBL fold metallo-hydrolase [Desulfovibrionaceae bacterium]|nr:MBL fold metallo-hydrolase [Desulfovibrionaceae bacterium]
MKIQQIRNATVRIEYGGKTFLTDPWLMAKGAMGCFADTPYRCANPAHEHLPMPLVDLPMPLSEILDGVDAYVVTHVHPDHIDMEADGTVGRVLEKEKTVFVQSPEDARVFLNSGFSEVIVLYENSALGAVRLVKTPGRHGTKIPCGPSCGVVFMAPGEKTLYVAGDTIWYDGVRDTIERFHPDVILVNACAAELKVEGRLIMNDQDVASIHAHAPNAVIVISHMDTVAHATLTRDAMRVFLKENNLQEFCPMPLDGETLSL